MADPRPRRARARRGPRRTRQSDGRTRLDSAWGPWDDEHEPPWMAEVERTLAELTAALDGREPAQAWTTTAQPSTPSLKLGKSQDEVPEVCGEAWDRFVSFA